MAPEKEGVNMPGILYRLDVLSPEQKDILFYVIDYYAREMKRKRVTTLSAKADSFLGHALTSVTRYAPNAPSERKDI